MQAHTSGDVGVLGTVLLRAYSRTIFAIFIDIGLYLTDKEQKISWHSFFFRHGVQAEISTTDIHDESTLTPGPVILSLTPKARPACSSPMNNLSCTYASCSQRTRNYSITNTLLTICVQFFNQPTFLEPIAIKAVVTCKIKHLQECCKNVLVFYFTGNHL